jgi:subtilisin family serine protease
MGLRIKGGAFGMSRLRRSCIISFAALGGGLAAPVAVAAAPRGAPVAVIVRGESPACTSVVAQDIAATGGHVTRTLGILDGAAALVPSGELGALGSSPCVAAVTRDGTISTASIGPYDPTTDPGSLYSTTLAIGAQAAWAQGYTGQGIGVALVDTGVTRVQGLTGPGHVVNGIDVSFDAPSPLRNLDGDGHGTHLAGIIAGNDTIGAPPPPPGPPGPPGSQYAGNTSQFLGVAPNARIVNVKVGDRNGVTDVSQVIAGIDWVVQHRNDPGLNIRVLNLSYGTDSGQSYVLDPLAFAAEVAWKSGIVVVTAAGNQGSGADGLTDPAYDPYVIAVGATNENGSVTTADDTVAGFSSWGDGVRNPDVVAPGAHIASLRDPGSLADTRFGGTATVDTRFFLGSGTSQAAAVVSGAVAVMLSAQREATPDQVKGELMQAATPLANAPAAAQGAGEINVAAAIALHTSGASQSFTNATGLGTLEGARGDTHVVAANGVVLTGEQDIFGNAWNSAAMAQAEQAGNAWSGGIFNGAAWSGAGWSGAAWSGAGWSGAAWSGAAWSGAGWSGAGWSGAAWSGAAWSGAAWSEASWS